MTKSEEIVNLAEALKDYLEDEGREYIMYFPIDDDEKYIAATADISSVIGLMFTLVKTYKIPISKVTEMLEIIEDNQFVDLTEINLEDDK